MVAVTALEAESDALNELGTDDLSSKVTSGGLRMCL